MIFRNMYDSCSFEIIFVPGWGLKKDFWLFVLAELVRVPGLNLTCTVLEFGSTLSLPPPDIVPRLVVGHSIGFLWLLQARPFHWDGLIAVNGFTRFIADKDFPQGVKADLLQRMLSQFQKNPESVVSAFLRRCGVHRKENILLKDIKLLKQGLLWLRDWDARSAFYYEQAPLLVLAGEADPIVSPDMTKACFRDRHDITILWQPTGGHVLPLSHPKWLAMHIWQFSSRCLRVY